MLPHTFIPSFRNTRIIILPAHPVRIIGRADAEFLLIQIKLFFITDTAMRDLYAFKVIFTNISACSERRRHNPNLEHRSKAGKSAPPPPLIEECRQGPVNRLSGS